MNKHDNTLLIWVLSWAAVLLALLYSPLGSPDLYSKRKYYEPNQGVNFNNISIYKGHEPVSFIKTIKNAVKHVTSNDSNDPTFEIPVNLESKKFNYSVSTVSSKNYRTGSINGNVTYNARKQQSSTSSGGNQMSGSSSNGSYTNNVANHSQSTSTVSSLSFSSNIEVVSTGNTVFSDTTLFADASNNIQPQRINNYSDPGSEPASNPIPVGDGWIALLVMVLSYCGFKMNLFQKLKRKIA